MTKKPDAFLSYTRFDDRRGRISEFCRELSETVEEVSGEPFDIFQDIEGIGIGEHWPDKLDDMLKQARFFIPIITPKFFRSAPCRDELGKFLEQERKVGRRDLVLPIYWIACPVLEEGHLKAKDELAQEIDERQHWDWRKLLFEDLTSKASRWELHALSAQIARARRNVLRLVEDKKPNVVGDLVRTITPQSRPTAATPAKPTISRQEAEPKKPTPPLWTPGKVFQDVDKAWCPEMVWIPSGTFIMGSPESEEGRFEDEGAQHEVTISRDFALGRFPVTFEQYDLFCELTKRAKVDDEGWGRKRRPIMNVSHSDAEAFCTWLSGVTGAEYRLPTEAEWEYACRARVGKAYYFGDRITKEWANFGFNMSKTNEVDAYTANDWGLYDMQGNVWEWCADARRAYSSESVTDPKGAGSTRVLRGGCWRSHPRYLRSASRLALAPSVKDGSIGFRCARDLKLAGQN